MSGRIPENILEEVLSRTNIVEVISGCIPLKRAGRNFKANCPFHHEKTPSFMVSPDRQIYHCFGCGESGNAFKFLMRYERMEFPEAVEALAKKTGVILPEFRKEDAQATNLVTQLYKINELAVLFYQNNLNSPAGAQAKNYLAARGLKPEAIKGFNLGLAPGKWDGLISFLRAKNIGLSLMEKAGLILAKDGGGYYDRFRNRIVFPIFDLKSRVVGFGARVLDDSLPKYINSPETPVYTKGRNLYGLNLSKDSIRDSDSAVVVEGYLDCLLPYQAGLKNIVASLGTALTLEQARLLKRYAGNVVMIYDPDAAGEMATLRSLDIFLDEEIEVRIATLPAGYDPDLFVRKNGIEALREKIAQAKTLFDYKLGILKSRFNHLEIEGKAKIAAGMLESINKFHNAVTRSEYLKKLAQDLDIREGALLEEAGKKSKEKKFAELNTPVHKKALNVSPTEKLLLKLMLEESQFIERVRGCLAPADFQDERVSRIVSAMFELVGEGKAPEAHLLMHRMGQEDIAQIVCESVFLEEDSTVEHKEKILDDCVRRLKSQNLKQKKERLHNEIKLAQHAGNSERLGLLLQEFHQLTKVR